MIDRIRELFGGRAATGAAKEPRIGELELAAAALLVEAARMDGRYDDGEREAIARLIAGKFGLDNEGALRLIDAAGRAMDEAHDLWGFARVVKDRFSHDERVELIEMLWEVVYADGELHEYEASLLRRIGGLIYVSDQDRGAARKRVLDRRGGG